MVLSGSAGSPELVDRRRIEIIAPAVPGAKQPYHFAENLPFREAENHIRTCAVSSEALALAEIRKIQESLGPRGYGLLGAAMVLAASRSLPPLADVLRSHPLIHTAEGEFFRKSVQQACEHCGIAVTGIRERELEARAKAEFGKDSARQLRKIEDLGRSLGPPWSQDYKRAALAAWLCLAGKPRKSAR